MAKLKFDRKLNIKMASEQSTTVPEDEVWKVSAGGGVRINGCAFHSGSASYGGPRNGFFGGGTVISTHNPNPSLPSPSTITGIAFKIIP